MNPGGGWTLVMNINPADGNALAYDDTRFWSDKREYGSFVDTHFFSADYKSPASYLLQADEL